jgi:hypothetical protein
MEEQASTAAKLINPEKLDLVVQESRLKVQRVEEQQKRLANINQKLQAGIKTTGENPQKRASISI